MSELKETKLFFPTNLTVQDLCDWDPCIKASKSKDKLKGTVISVNEVELALFRCKNEVFAIKAKCPHLGGPLHMGDIEALPDKSLCVRCPWHSWRFDLRTGKIRLPEGKNITASVYPTKIDDKNKILIGFDSIDPNYFTSDKF